MNGGRAVQQFPLRGLAEKSDVAANDQAQCALNPWDLLTVIDFFSRWIIACVVLPTVHADDQSHLPGGVKQPRISIYSLMKPELNSIGIAHTSGLPRSF